MTTSPRFREITAKLDAAAKSQEMIKSQIPHTMVMMEKPMGRETFVLKRGIYDQVDRNRPVTRAIPKVLEP